MSNENNSTPYLNTASCPNKDETNRYLTRSEMLETSKILANAPRLISTSPRYCEKCEKKDEKIREWEGNYTQEMHANNHLVGEMKKLIQKEGGKELWEKVSNLVYERRKNPHVIINIDAYLVNLTNGKYPIDGSGHCFYSELTEEEKPFIARLY